MKRLLSILLSIVLIISLAVPIATAAESSTESIVINVSHAENEGTVMLQLINELRTDEETAWYWNEKNTSQVAIKDLSELTYDYSLEQTAMQRAAEIAVYYTPKTTNDKTTYRPDGSSFVTAYSTKPSTFGECIIAGPETIQEAFDYWAGADEKYSGQEDRRLILSTKFKGIGMGHVYFNGTHYWVLEFSDSVSSKTEQEISDEVEIKVSDTYIQEAPSAEPSDITVEKGDSTNLPGINMCLTKTWPEDTAFTAYLEDDSKWTVTNDSIAKIENGKIVGVADGETKVTAIVGSYTVTANITVKTHQHEMEKTEAKEATCTDEGNDEYYTCKTCGKYYSDEAGTTEIKKDSWVIAAKGHTYGDEWTVTREATCTDPGSKQKKCSVCDNILTKKLTETGHTFSDWYVTKAATHDATGIEERMCSSCGTKQSRTIAATGTCPSASYTDVNKNTSNWTHEPIDYCLKKGYMTGTSTTAFSPNGTVSRAMVVQVLYAMEGKPSVTTSAGFKDVISTKWYVNAVNWAAANGIVSGYDNGNFGVYDPVKRQDLMLMLMKYAKLKGYDVTADGDISKFADLTSISAYATDCMKWGVGNNLISGIVSNNKTYAQPKATATRAQLAVILKAFDENIKK